MGSGAPFHAPLAALLQPAQYTPGRRAWILAAEDMQAETVEA
jgi:hypothetical protein